MVKYPDPDTRNVLEPGCSRCPELVASRENIAWGNGSLDADVMVVGEAPGAGNPAASKWQGGNWTGLAFTVEHSGRIIRRMFEELGYSPSDLYVTNAVKCFPEQDGMSREPTTRELRTCFTHLETEIAAVDPVVVVAAGKQATRILFEHEGISVNSFLGSVLHPTDCPSLGVTVLPILHPSYQFVWISRLGFERHEYIEQIGVLLDEILS